MEDKELKELAEAEYYEAKEMLPKLEEELKILLIPTDPNDDKNIICEIRAGAGGEEADSCRLHLREMRWRNGCKNR